MAGQLAVSPHVPVPLVIVTVAVVLVGVPPTGPTEQTPVGARVGMTLAFVVAVTLNWLLKTALAGAPVKLTVGAARDAIVVWEPEAAA